MTPSEIKPGMKFGHWEVIKFDHSNEHRVKYFLCKCDVCGTTRPVRATALIGGTSTSCSKRCSASLIGMRFGKLEVLAFDKSKPRNYICKCDCGNTKSIFGGSLTTGCTKSCGCLKIENTKKRFEENAKTHIGEKYGKLTILDCEPRSLKNGDKMYYYYCECECGNNTWVRGQNLFNGITQSCGCINSKANEEMARILTRLKVPFKREYRFEGCQDKRPLPFDFALFNHQGELIGLIENNGDQHYSSRGTQWNTPENLVYTQKHDYIKQKFAENNHIPLLIIPYQYFNELEKFLVTSDFWRIITRNFNDYALLNEACGDQL